MSWSDSLALVGDLTRRGQVGELSLTLPREFLPSHVCGQIEDLSRTASARGAHVRVICREAGGSHDVLARSVRGFEDAGARARTVSQPGGAMLVVDDELAILPVQSGLGPWCAVLRGRILVAAYKAVFDETWELYSRSESLPTSARAGALALTPREREALRLLADGLTDEGISRRTDLSVRTLRRVIAGVMLRMGAQSRFQAGAEAVRRGWI
ncbi:LuxR C-terminal-related transcriptional regulator [Streptomyces sp. NBC_00247]|uniref:helix-turn-helix transcriptional regulator n=1 Tax=Streptomyces sp. NBC_00247 TaxID=2975689 RepID=UPI002E2BA8F7|nr:LuxR C-terminal-related transcriptional regulator [Streptomyces sp. NBC_00247]